MKCSLIQNTITKPSDFEFFCKGKIHRTESGFLIINYDKHVGEKIEKEGIIYEDFIISYASNLISRDSVVIDCGSMYGSAISAFQDKIGHEGMIIGIEPGRIMFECLKQNLPNPFSRIILLNNALCDIHQGWLRHKVTDDCGSSLVTDWDHTGDNIISMTIDGIIKYICTHRLDLIKIKCQGWEYKILLGALNTLDEYSPKIIMEINHSQLSLHKNTFQEIKDLLKNQWYKWKIIEPELTESSDQFNILCEPLPLDDAVHATIMDAIKLQAQ